MAGLQPLSEMLQVLIRFLTFNVMSEHPAVYWGLAVIWIILLAASVSSLRVVELPTEAKVVWFAVICCVPIFGLGLYAFRCLIKGDWGFLKPLLSPPRNNKKIAPR